MIYREITGKNNFYFHRHTFFDVLEEEARKLHYHNLFEIYFITEGTCNYFINNRTYSLLPGDIILIPEGVIHNAEYTSNGHCRLLINCSRQFIPTGIAPSLKSIGYLYRNKSIYDEVINIFNKIEYEYTNTDELSEDIFRCYTNSLFFLMVRNENTYDKESTGNEHIEACINYIQKNFSGEISLSRLAEVCSVSPEYLSRMFKKETGFGFCEYVNILRLQKAEQLIRQSPDLTITKISADCGFEDSNYFSVKFKKRYGISPKKLQISYHKRQRAVKTT